MGFGEQIHWFLVDETRPVYESGVCAVILSKTGLDGISDIVFS